jgi:hypothetical protein
MLAEASTLGRATVSDTSKSKDQAKYNLWSYMMGKSTVTKPPEPMEETKTHRAVAPVSKMKKTVSYIWAALNWLATGFGGELL